MQRKRVFPNNNLTECRQTYRERDRDGRHTERGTGTADRQREGNIDGNQLMEHTRRQQRDKQKQRKRCRKHENLPQTRRTKNKIEHSAVILLLFLLLRLPLLFYGLLLFIRLLSLLLLLLLCWTGEKLYAKMQLHVDWVRACVCVCLYVCA